MAVSSLSHYPDRPKGPTPEGNDAALISSRRITSLWIRIVWVAGIWGALFAVRSVLLSQESQDPRDVIIGTWEAADGSGSLVTFEFGHFAVWHEDKVWVSGSYEIKNDGSISTTMKTWDTKTDKEVEWHYSTFRATVTEDELIINDRNPSSSHFGMMATDGAPLHLKRKH
jgi:hypothetical protein